MELNQKREYFVNLFCFCFVIPIPGKVDMFSVSVMPIGPKYKRRNLANDILIIDF